MTDWYKLSKEESAGQLGTAPETGLDDTEAASRLNKYGPNELIEKGVKSPWLILWEQLTGTMVVILIVAAVISYFLGDAIDTIAILAIVILNALLGFRQEYKAEQAMAALKKLAVPSVRVRRGGHVREISARELVPGDIVLLEAGNLVPADARLLMTANLRIQEAALTGESEAVDKDENFTASADVPLGDRFNMAFMGTIISYGRGEAMVTQTGMKTELGGIAEMLQTTVQEPTPLQRRLAQLGRGLAVAAIGLVAIVFVLGLLRGEPLRLMFLTAISMTVAAVPEGLPAVVTIALALGAQQMLKRRALIRKLPAVETLGSVTVICSDKTGTLTENRMTVTILDVAGSKIDLDNSPSQLLVEEKSAPCADMIPDPQQLAALSQHPSLALLTASGALCNDSILECDDDSGGRFQIVGDPTEGALVLAAVRLGLKKELIEEFYPRVAEVPFDSDRKRMTTVHRCPADPDQLPQEYKPGLSWGSWPGDAPYIAFTKGAVDGLIDICSSIWVNDHVEPIDPSWIARIVKGNQSLAENGMRVVAIATRRLDTLPEKVEAEQVEQDLVMVGLVAMIDPAREEVKDAVATCRTAGIRPLMITGDHPLTAGYIARELGINDENGVVTGAMLEKMTPEELETNVFNHSVYARVSPEHKLRIVQALQKRGEIAAMTGDGVNDAPALKKADIGVAMGITGTDVTKEAADMVLLDDNFATIVAAVEVGRTIYDNIRKFIQYTLTSNAGEIWVMLLAPLFGMPLPLLPLQILWINLVTDGLPGLALAVEPSEPDTMRRPPYPPNENIFARGMASHIIWFGLLMGGVSLAVGYWLWGAANPLWQTMVFTTITLSQMGHAMAIRSNRYSLFQIGLLSNKPLLGAVLLTFVLQLAVIYLPFLQEVFETVALPLPYLLLSLALSSVVFVAVEITKAIHRRTHPEPGA
ncbi:MAG: cation-translocating P-type ATPase [Anaerolineales bacterium]